MRKTTVLTMFVVAFVVTLSAAYLISGMHGNKALLGSHNNSTCSNVSRSNVGSNYSDLFTPVPTPTTSKTLRVKPSGKVTIHEVFPSVQQSNTTNESSILVHPGWSRYRIVYGRVGWGVYTIHPLIVSFENGSGAFYEAWMNVSVQTPQDVLAYIRGARFVWINWNTSTLAVEGHTFKIIAWRVITGKGTEKVVHTKYWNKFWKKELGKLRTTASSNASANNRGKT